MKATPQLFKVFGDDAPGPWEEHDLSRRVDFQAVAVAGGHEYKGMALQFLKGAGARVVRVDFRIDALPVDAQIVGPGGSEFLVLAHGTPDAHGRSGLRRVDTLEKTGFFAIQLSRRQKLPILLVTSDLPEPGSRAAQYLSYLSEDVWDVVATRDDFRGFQRLFHALRARQLATPPLAPWRDGSMTTRGGERQLTLDWTRSD